MKITKGSIDNNTTKYSLLRKKAKKLKEELLKRSMQQKYAFVEISTK